jgi:MFS family permease
MASYSTSDLKNSIYDGMFANVFATLTGGVFLTGFALFLDMNEFMIGLIASMPFLATVFQLPVSFVIRKNGRRKAIALCGAAVSRILWLPILFVGLLPLSAGTRLLGIMILIFLSHTFASVSYVSWLSWITDLVPEGIRAFFRHEKYAERRGGNNLSYHIRENL